MSLVEDMKDVFAVRAQRVKIDILNGHGTAPSEPFKIDGISLPLQSIEISVGRRKIQFSSEAAPFATSDDLDEDEWEPSVEHRSSVPQLEDAVDTELRRTTSLFQSFWQSLLGRSEMDLAVSKFIKLANVRGKGAEERERERRRRSKKLFLIVHYLYV